MAEDPNDINPRKIALVAAGLAITLAVVILLAWLAWHHWRKPEPGSAPDVAAQPLLESSPQADLARYRAQQQRKLRRWGWAAGEPGVAQVPIDVAMQMLAQRDAAHRSKP